LSRDNSLFNKIDSGLPQHQLLLGKAPLKSGLAAAKTPQLNKVGLSTTDYYSVQSNTSSRNVAVTQGGQSAMGSGKKPVMLPRTSTISTSRNTAEIVRSGNVTKNTLNNINQKYLLNLN